MATLNLQPSVSHNPSGTILTCWFGPNDFIIISVEISAA